MQQSPQRAPVAMMLSQPSNPAPSPLRQPDAVDTAEPDGIESPNETPVLANTPGIQTSGSSCTTTATKAHQPSSPLHNTQNVKSNSPPIATSPSTLPRGERSNPRPSAPSQQRLVFRLEKRIGAPDLDDANLVPRKEIWQLRLPELFAFVCTKMALEEGSLSYLTLMYQWGGRDDITLQREDSDQQWQYAKKMIENLFKSAKKDNPHERWLEIWVKGGCEEEEDW